MSSPATAPATRSRAAPAATRSTAAAAPTGSTAAPATTCLTGGASLDGFYFDAPLNAATNVDQILDFSTVQDTIFLDRTVFTGIAASGTLAGAAFRAGTAALDADDRILYDTATGQIRYDADGIGGVAAILFATVTPGLVLTNADFVGY